MIKELMHTLLPDPVAPAIRRWGMPVALVLSTFLFVLPHLGSSGLPITQMIGGILFAAAYEIEGSLIVPIMIHAFGNMAIFSFSLLP